MSDKTTRIDKWLWAVRIFKSRTLATTACKSGKVKVGEKTVKPSFAVSIKDHLHVRKNGYDLQFIVKDIISKRVSATLAAPCYENITPAEEMEKYKSWFIGKANAEVREKGAGRPTKKERREIEDYKLDQFWDYYDEETDI